MHGAELVSLSGWVEKRLSEDEETRLASSSTAYQRQMELSKSALSSSSLSSSSSSFGAKTPPVGGGAAGMVLRAAYDELLIREPLKGVTQGLPARLWKAHYGEIDPLQKALRHLKKQEMRRMEQQRTKLLPQQEQSSALPSSVALVSELRSRLHASLQTAGAEYASRVRRLVSIEGDLSADCGRDSHTSGGTPMKDDGEGGGSNARRTTMPSPFPHAASSKRGSFLECLKRILQAYLSALGDVHRYRAALLTMECADYEEQQDAERCGESEHTFIVAKFGAAARHRRQALETARAQQWTAAELYYWQALRLDKGGTGKAWNQLAVCALSQLP